MKSARSAGSIGRRLTIQLLAVAAILSALLYLAVRSVADAAVEATQDSILGAAAVSIAEELRGGDEGVGIDIPYATFSILGAVGDDRIFYRILIGADTVTGYETLALPPRRPSGLTPVFYAATHRGDEVRIAAVERALVADGRVVDVLVLVAQSQTARAAIVARLANWAAVLGLGFFLVAALLSVMTARSVLQPMNRLSEAVERRGPRDLRPVERPVPSEFAPMVAALNGFMARLATALDRTETFIAEAAHHIRTPLATLRAQSEIALHRARDDETKVALRAVIRSTDDAARSASQLLDHALVSYRTDQHSVEVLDLNRLTRDVVVSMAPAADIKDVALTFEGDETPIDFAGDQLLMESAIRNLIDNAIKYSDPDGSVSVSCRVADQHITVRVCDRGRGLGGADQAGLARRFQRGTNVEDIVGSGLGLTIVSEVARAHQGGLELREREKGGTCAELSLPLR